MNKPRYLASQQRAKLFAEFQRTQVLWVQAEDFPLSGEIATMAVEKLNQRRQDDFLRRHDQDTGGIMGLFPMVYNLPVTFTSTVDKKRKIHKFTRGHVIGWTLDVADEQRVRESMDFEIVLQKQPTAIFIRRDGEGMPQHEDCEAEVYALKPKSSDWALDPPSNDNWIKRFGFPFVPDFVCRQ